MEKVVGNYRMGRRNGLHLRPAQQLMDLAMSFKSAIVLRRADRSADAKCIFDLITLGAVHGSVIEIQAEGEDASEALRALGEFLERTEEPEPAGET